MLVVMAASDASAFDGKRKGFTIGIGGNVSPLMSIATTKVVHQYRVSGDTTYYRYVARGDRVYKFGYGYNLTIGYSWNEYNTISWMQHHSIYQVDPVISLGTAVFAWTHYFQPAGRSLYTIMGVGWFMRRGWSRELFDDDLGVGVVAGIGYEFRKHFGLSAVIQRGNYTSDLGPVDGTIVTVGLDVAAY